MVLPLDFEAILHRVESDTLDFKRDQYNLRDDNSKIDLIKDIVCMWNTPRDDSSLIVLGVKRTANGASELYGVPHHLDQADIQSQLNDRVHPVPTVAYYPGKPSVNPVGRG